MSYKTKLTSGSEADRNQGEMKEVTIKTATERDKTSRPYRPAYFAVSSVKLTLTLGNNDD